MHELHTEDGYAEVDTHGFGAEDELAWFASIWEALLVFALVCAFCAGAAFAIGWLTQ